MCNMSICACFLSLLLLCVFRNVCSNCVFQNGAYDLSTLDRLSGWPVSGTTSNGTQHFEISICRPLNYTSPERQGCAKSSVCLISNNSAVSFGNAIEDPSDYAFAQNMRPGFSLYVLTNALCKSSGKHRAVINFFCGPHLGVPELTLANECQVHFKWRTSAACPVKPKNRQVPCYVMDDKGDIRNLSPLMQNNGYSVITPNPAIDFIVNVCSDLSLNTSRINCTKNASACRISGKEYYSFGTVSEALEYSSEGLQLTYRTSDNSPVPPDCQLRPKTTIFFKCPARGYSQPPKLISDSNCQYEVEWETEYACPESMLKGNLKTCQFTRESHGVAIDLSPLSGRQHHVTSNVSGNSFVLSVCSGLRNFTCGGKLWQSTTVCVFNSSGASEIAGTTDSNQLMYADGEISLTYMKGDPCNGSEYMSYITFICDLNGANDGDGEPQHIGTDNCTYFFEWRTKHACLKHPLDTPCSVTFDKKTVNLQKLLLVTGEPWEAIDGRLLKSNGVAEYFINICGQISKLGNYSMCGKGSSACMLNSKGEYLNLGNFTSPPVYDRVSDSVRLHYSGGSLCRDNKFWQSTIDFICKPGQINSKPVLTRIDENECHYEFEWLTADACPTGIIEGSDCRVFDSNLGIKYDLTPLKSKIYKVDSPLYEFFLGICEPVTNSPCSDNSNSSNSIGVCQVDKANKTSWKAGEPSSRLSYMDGVVNLTYLSGDPYDDKNRTSRVTIIIFICDFNAGNGHPHFVEDENFALVFHWYTTLVCPQLFSSECMVHDPFSSVIYDLAVLSTSKKNYMAIFNENNKERKVYLNVCSPLTLPTACDPNAAACLVEFQDGKEIVVVPNLGRAINPPVLQSPGHVTLWYTNGDPCVSYGDNTTYSTLIHFLCIDDAFETGFKFLSKIGFCEYSFLWATKAACPTGQLQSNDRCQLTDPESGFTFDLMTLHKVKEPYSVLTSSGRNFQLNICGSVVEGCYAPDGGKQPENISVCEMDGKGNVKSNIATSDSYILSYSPITDLTLTYKSPLKTPNKDVVIRFPCSNSTTASDLKFLHDEGGQYIFEMKTSLTCVPEPIECNVIDQFGHEYDFSPLAKYSGENWEVSDIRPEYSHMRYHINFCRPLNKIPSYQCPGGASSACQTDFNNTESTGYDLGSQMMEPIISSNGAVIIHYTNGSPCHNGQFKRSTVITLYCSHQEGDLVFLGETPECEYTFTLDTPAACALESSLGENCLVRDPLFGYVFDLNPLKSKNSSYNVSVGEYTYAFNVCDKLNGFGNKCANSSACQLKPNDPDFSKSIGLPSDVLVYLKGLITLEYKSGSNNCHGKYNRTTKITFSCHHAHEDKDGPIFIGEEYDCTYLFDWPTVHACPPFDVIECSVVDDKGLYYDLSRLSLPFDNYYVKHPYLNKTFVINVCRSVVHTPSSLCPYTSAACLVDSSSAVEALNLGTASHGPYFDNGKIKMNYTLGDPCDEEDPLSARFMQTVIEFTCDLSSVDSEPEFIGKDDCTYYFDWHTAFACPSGHIEGAGDCTVQDPITGHLFNFSSLRNQGLFKHRHGDHLFSLNVCGSSSQSSCGASAGMCQEEVEGEKRHWTGGKLNYNLTYINGILYLNYTDGDSCHNGKFKRNTLIEFHCGKGVNEPQFLFESHDCTYYFSWKTELACQSLMHCAVKNGSIFYDLVPLAESHHIAATSVVQDAASYYISVCSSLEDFKKVPGCPPDAGICRVSWDPATSSSVAESLGKVHYPIIDFMDHVTVMYVNGSACKKSPEHLNRARIIFLCDSNAGMGEPVLINYSEDCFFLFEWRTSILCPEKPEVPPSFTSCNYTDNSRGIHFDLLPLQRTGTKSYYEVPGGENMSFKLNICSALRGPDVTKCGEAGICGKSGNVMYNYGIATSQKFTYSGGRLRLMFYDGDDCPAGMNGKRTSEIFFVCDPTAGLGEPELHKKYTCLAVFMWRTALVCLNMQQQCAFDIGGHHYDFNLLTSLSHNWVTSDSKNNTYWINICRGIQPTADTFGCTPTSAVCMMNSNGYHLSLGMVHSMQIKLDQNSSGLILTFDNGDARACPSPNSSARSHAVVRLFMRCGRSLGRPRIFSGPDNKCYYDFVWESSLACADKAEEVMIEKDGIIKDKRLDFSFDINDILNRSFIVAGNNTNDHYIYKINLSGGVARNVSDSLSTCAKAAVCQTKPNTDFERDVGSVETRTFIVRGSELHLVFKSLTRKCGKNPSKEVTTLINMQCSSPAGFGAPEFIYESGNCDYIFEWSTIVVCPDYHRKSTDPTMNTTESTTNGTDYNMNGTDPKTNAFKDVSESHHSAEITVGVIFAIIAIMIIVFIVIKPERRAIISFRFRSLFGRVSLPYFRYKRCDGEKLVLVDSSRALYDEDDEILRC